MSVQTSAILTWYILTSEHLCFSSVTNRKGSGLEVSQTVTLLLDLQSSEFIWEFPIRPGTTHRPYFTGYSIVIIVRFNDCNHLNNLFALTLPFILNWYYLLIPNMTTQVTEPRLALRWISSVNYSTYCPIFSVPNNVAVHSQHYTILLLFAGSKHVLHFDDSSTVSEFTYPNWIALSYYSCPKHKSLLPKYLIHFCTQ